MDRRTFFRNLVLGAAAVPAAMLAKPSVPRRINNPAWENAEYGMSSGGAWYRRSLIDWLNDVRSECVELRVQCSSDAMEYFRERADAMVTGAFVRFELERYPYRNTDRGIFITPFYIDNDGASKLNPSWKYARVEQVIAYHGSTVHFAPYDRTTFLLKPL